MVTTKFWNLFSNKMIWHDDRNTQLAQLGTSRKRRVRWLGEEGQPNNIITYQHSPEDAKFKIREDGQNQHSSPLKIINMAEVTMIEYCVHKHSIWEKRYIESLQESGVDEYQMEFIRGKWRQVALQNGNNLVQCELLQRHGFTVPTIHLSRVLSCAYCLKNRQLCAQDNPYSLPRKHQLQSYNSRRCGAYTPERANATNNGPIVWFTRQAGSMDFGFIKSKAFGCRIREVILVRPPGYLSTEPEWKAVGARLVCPCWYVLKTG